MKIKSPLNRRAFLNRAGAAAGMFALASELLARDVFAATKDAPPPKPQNVLTPQEAKIRLLAGNARYVDGVTRRHDFRSEREALTGGQNPYAAVLGCADSRIAPEYAFDSARGDLFVARVAGNFVNDDTLGSLEYAVAVLGAPLLMVLGHDSCGAVSAAIKVQKDHETFPGHIQKLADAITPSVRKVAGEPGDILNNAIRQNVIDNVEALKNVSPILHEAVDNGKLLVIGGIYRLASGRVDLV